MYFYVGFLLLTVFCFPASGALPVSCKTEWEINWNQQFPNLSDIELFPNPGEILPGVTVNETLQFVGFVWNVPDSWQELVGHSCIHFGPLLNTLFPEMQIRSICDPLVTSLQKGLDSNILNDCVSSWNKLGVDNLAQSLLSDYDLCLQYDRNSSECQRELLATVFETNFLEKSSNIAFKLLDWLGPSPFSGDWYGACSALRLLLGNRIDQIVDEIRNVLVYPVAYTLEYFHQEYICNTDDTVRDVLKVFQRFYFCDFLSGNPSRQEYIEKSEKLIDAVLSIDEDSELCTNALATLVHYYDPHYELSYQITGRNLSAEANRKLLCNDISSSFSDTSSYTPTSYSIPFDEISVSDYSLKDNFFQDLLGSASWLTWFFNAEPGQLFLGFSFTDAVNVLGAFFRSDKLSDGVVVICDVFESFLSDVEPRVESMCDALRNDDASEAEKVCLELLIPNARDSHPSLRKPTETYMIVTGVDMTRKLLELPAISREYVCTALNEYFHSNNNLQSLVRFGLNVYLTEFLPSADKICKDYESVFNFLEVNVPEFNRVWHGISDVLLTSLGFSDRNQLCVTIDAGIDASSGRVKGALDETIQNRTLSFLTDRLRCKMSAQSVHGLLVVLDVVDDIGFEKYITQYTGYESIDALCEDLNAFFDPGLCQASSTGTTPEISFLPMVLTILVTHLKYMM